MLLASNRGPYRFERAADGSFSTRPGAGGVASALTPLLEGLDDPAIWVAAAIGDDDRDAVRDGAAHVDGVNLQLLGVDPELARRYYDVVSNATLWFLHHDLFDLARRPRFDHRWRDAWSGYETVNRAFATRIADVAPEHDIVLVQDYHLALVPGLLNGSRPDLRVVHFGHTPFCGRSSIRVLPSDVATQICSSMATVPCGFHTRRWARGYEAAAHEILGAETPVTGAFASSLGPDLEALNAVASSAEAEAATGELEEMVGDRLLLLRADRIDPSKNVVRGFLAYDRLLEKHPEWRGRVVFVAMLNASREGLAEYLAYHREVEQAVERVNDRWATGDWQPVVLDERDDFARSVAGLCRYDVLYINPLKDGLNLVAKEGPLLNRRDGTVCLSPEAGAFEELGDAVLPVHPYDLEQNVESLQSALSMSKPERAGRAARLRELAGARTPRDWLADQLTRAGSPTHG